MTILLESIKRENLINATRLYVTFYGLNVLDRNLIKL
jgi:hypothetical protein